MAYNSGIIKSLAVGRIRSHRVRSAVICLSVILTAVLFMTVISISVNTVNGYQTVIMLQTGADYHAYVRCDAYDLRADELYDIVCQSEDVKEAAFIAPCAYYSLEEGKSINSRRLMTAVQNEKTLGHMFTSITEGTFPANDDEILLNRDYFPDVKVGDVLRVYYIVDELDEHGFYTSHEEYADFKVSGFVKGESKNPCTLFLRYSRENAEKYAIYTQILLSLKNELAIEHKADILSNSLLEYRNDKSFSAVNPNPAYLSSSIKEALNPATVFAVILAIFVVLLCAFLLIYNIYSIALVQDMQSMGLLSVIGMTRRQTAKMIVLESLILYGVSIPVGLFLGYFIGFRLLSPMFLSMAYSGIEYKFSVIIPIFTVIFTLAALLFSAVRPLKKLKNMTPIETVDYSPSVDMPKKFVRRKNFAKKHVTPNTAFLAKNSISRSKKKYVITALSSSVAIILFVFIATAADYAYAYTMANLQPSDLILTPERTEEMVLQTGESLNSTRVGEMEAGFYISNDMIELIDSSPLTDSYSCLRYTTITLDTTEEAKKGIKEYFEINEYAQLFAYLVEAYEGKLNALVVGIPDKYFAKLPFDEYNNKIKLNQLFSEKEIEDKFYSGDCVLFNRSTTSRWLDAEKNLLEFSYYREGENVKIGEKNYSVVLMNHPFPLHQMFGYSGYSAYIAIFYLPESVFLADLGEGHIHTIMLDAKDGYDELLRNEISAYADSCVVLDEDIYTGYEDIYLKTYSPARFYLSDFKLNIRGRLDGLENMQKQLNTIRTVGYSLTWIIFLIGMLNIVNTSVSSANERKRELAMLEAVGMTEKQMRKMLIRESIYSGLISALIVLLVGFPLIAVVVNTAMNALVSISYLPGVLMLLLSVGISTVTSVYMMKSAKNSPVTERLKHK